MGCQAEVLIGDNLTFSITTHDPETGILTDADAPPTYRIYEDESGQVYPAGAALGNMAKLDDANTTGFYTELVACTTANGFEDGKSYTIYIEATVDTFLGGIAFSFKAKAKLLESTLSYDDAWRIILAAVAGKSTGGGTANVAYRDVADGKDRIAATVDVDGNRTVIVLDGTL
jgi:hypothetical protein